MLEMKKIIEINNHLSTKVSIAIMIFVLLSVAFYSVSSMYINSSYEDTLTQSMSQEQKIVNDFFSYPENIINILSRNSDFAAYEANNRTLRNSILSLYQSIIIADSRISNIYYVSNDGISIVYDNTEKPEGDLTQTSWFKKAADEKTQIIWISHKSDFSGEGVISCLRQVSDKYSRPIGVIGLDIKLFKISQVVENEKKGNKVSSMILDADNKIIAHPDYTYLGEYISDNHLMDSIGSTNDKSSILKIKNKRFKCRVVQLKKLPWKFVYAVLVDDIIFSIIKWTVLFILFSIISFAIVFILINANEKLKEHASIIEELAVSKERNRFARDVHDTLGHTMTVLISMLDAMCINYEGEGRIKEDLTKTVEIARNGLKELRQSISGLTAQKRGTTSLIRSLRNLIAEYESSGVKIDFSIEGEFHFKNPVYSEVIYRSCQEAMTNALRHGKASQVTIILQTTRRDVKLFIFDDGIGCKDIKKGYGLSGMEQRIKSLNGNIIYGSDGERGFNINIELPMERLL